MILVIAEKPSVAQTIAAVLGAKEKKEWKIKRYCLIILIKFIQPKWELIELKET